MPRESVVYWMTLSCTRPRLRLVPATLGQVTPATMTMTSGRVASARGGPLRSSRIMIELAKAHAFGRNFLRDATVVLGIVVLAALVPTVMSPTFRAGSPEAFGFYALLVAYVALGTLGFRTIVHCLKPVRLLVYCALHLALYAGMLALPIRHGNLWILAMPVISHAASTLRWPVPTAVVAGYLGLMIIYWRRSGDSWNEISGASLAILTAMVFTVAFTVVAIRAGRSHEQAEKLATALEQANAQLRAAAAQTAALAAADERNRIARDIHDGLGHYLAVIAVQLQAARALLPEQPERAIAAVAKAEELSRTALDDVRRSVGTLRASQARPPLTDALAGLVRECGLEVAMRVEGDVRALPEAAEQAIFRTVQEGLTNIRKHAGDTHGTIVLDFRAAGRVGVEIADSGRGCPGEPAGGFGLPGLRERLAALGGTLTAGNGAAGGFALRAEVPV
jgi:signal transduction histidine kinase